MINDNRNWLLFCGIISLYWSYLKFSTQLNSYRKINKSIICIKLILTPGGNAFYRYNSDGNQLVGYFGHGDQVNNGCFRLKTSVKDGHVDGKDGCDQVITCSGDGTVRIWDMDSGECLYTFFNHRSQNMKTVDVNRAGDMVLSPNSNGMLYILTSWSYW